MQFEFILIFLFIWSLSLWLGSIGLEATGMERTKARFQSLSALTGSGFTTREAESVVNHPHRRFIVSWLMFIGNAGLILFIVALILYVQSNLSSMALVRISIMIGIFVAFILFIWLGVMDKLSTRMVGWFHRKGYLKSDLPTGEILHHLGDYVVSRLLVDEKAKASGYTLKDTGIGGRDITILAIERGNTVLPLPDPETKLLSGDYILCYGKMAEMNSL